MATRKPKANALDKGETIIGERTDEDGRHIAVTSEGRKVILDADGGVIERLMGPAYGWEVAEVSESAEADDDTGDE